MNKNKRKKIIDMTSTDARSFLLKSSNYVNITLPQYFNFDSIIDDASTILNDKDLTEISKTKKSLSNTENVNYTILVNNGSDYAWRPLQILHPIVYVDLVNTITEEQNWKKICDRFKGFRQNPKIECISIPLESLTNKNDTAETILNWWENLEQAQIEIALDFEYCITTDIADCYSSIYTHSIPWAIHTKQWAKDNKYNKKAIGNLIDSKISYLQHGQTNGIPQGSVLMDFIAEIVLGYVDLQLSNKLEGLTEEGKLNDYKIIRYRDDYRIFSNYKEDAETIIKLLTKVLFDVNLNLNSSKTFLSTDIIQDAIKPDKIYWDMKYLSLYDTDNSKRIFKVGIQKHLHQIKILSDEFPNSGSIKRALTDLYKFRISKLNNKPNDIHQIISIVTHIMSKNPNSIELCIAILSKLFMFLPKDKVNDIINSILFKFQKMPNTDFIEIWLQRLSIVYGGEKQFNAKLCQKIKEKSSTNIWDSSWISEDINFDESSIIDEEYISTMHKEILISEIDLFFSEY